VEGDLQRAVGAKLRVYRAAQGLSQEGFADLLGVHRTYMGALERGERNLTLQSVERLAERLGVSAVELLGGSVGAVAARAEAGTVPSGSSPVDSKATAGAERRRGRGRSTRQRA
jgi:transcriptional regulator with XRE-family HTH domain